MKDYHNYLYRDVFDYFNEQRYLPQLANMKYAETKNPEN